MLIHANPFQMDIEAMKTVAKEIRIQIIKMLTKSGSGHPGGSLSAVDILSVLFFNKMVYDPKNPDFKERDRFILSKGHGCPALYATLARAGYFPSEELLTLRILESRLQGHPDRTRLPGIEASTGSLGQGLSIAQGMAIAQKMDKSGARTYCLIGDGESQEGQIWEAALSAPKFKLDNLVVICDYNHGQIDGKVDEVMPLEPLKLKWEAFNWNVLEMDGHNIKEILDSIDLANNNKGRPSMIIAHTIKGKGVSFMESDIVKWHGVAPTQEEGEAALKELRR